jgi:predicted RNA-binding Zn-ribbon protein involved in translation (DUF1610 family)
VSDVNEYNNEVEVIQQTTTREETDKKCPSCGGVMDFDPVSGGLLCPYCGHQQAIPPHESNEERCMEQDFYSAAERGNCDWGVEKKTVICKSCGGESIYDALQIADVCPYCGSNQVMEEAAVNTLAPGGVCPFRIDAKTAGERFTAWIKKKLFCPSKAKQSARPDAFKGVYLPYWTFDSQTETDYTARYGIDHTYTDSNGNTHTTTTWYNTSGHYSCFIDDQAVCGTTRYNEATLRSIEPYDTANNKKYKPEYIAGFISERYSIGLNDAWEKGKGYISSRLESDITDQVRRAHHADHVNSVRMATKYFDIKYKYLLLPVWLSSFKYKEKIFQFMVNGETGKVGGKSPISALRVAIAVLIGLALAAGLLYLYSKK